jgi:hypothetical protein
MRLLINLALFVCIFNFSKSNEVQAQTTAPGYVSFNLGKSPVPSQTKQELTLYGCNTMVRITTNDSVLYVTTDSVWRKEKSLTWDSSGQVFVDIPYGTYGKGQNQYFVSKYYMASPPVFETKVSSKNKMDSVKIANIGLVIPDQFTFFGEKPVQIVHLDYTILEPVYLNYVGINYNYTSGTEKSCTDLGIDLVPLNIQCADFAWIDKKGSKIVGAKGASGIGRVRNEDGQRQVFLPSYVSDSTNFLDCEITILDDIIKGYDVSFVTDQGQVKSLNLTDFHKNNSKNGKINLTCKSRTQLPVGCKENVNK